MIFELVSFSIFAVITGIRHGIDSDHIAAIADMVGMESEKTRQLKMGITYSLGHGSIVLVIGLLAIFLGTRLPESVLSFLEFLVGASLLVLGGFILFSVFKQKKEYQFQSRLQIFLKIAERLFKRKFEISKWGVLGAFSIGILHGIGAETPTQVLIISTSLGFDNLAFAVLLLLLFTIGVIFSTIFITYAASWGFMKARFKRGVYIFIGSLTGVYSLFLGISIMERWFS
ncbi:High-affinity nickel-transporter [Microaerobacter geothermalis]|uniref:HoxN/HupN/NixA family nickel/cobalt transporter n=1 Tax=Microaerobacter geothermalis TaxID=674972 RepID=UPI001F28CD49|nr:High-affinity nickel-transporter [Microaerobacter geothermalis]MCF6095272.1 High-affinity nickel-transporter [Microaerobacter geothermalis]